MDLEERHVRIYNQSKAAKKLPYVHLLSLFVKCYDEAAARRSSESDQEEDLSISPWGLWLSALEPPSDASPGALKEKRVAAQRAVDTLLEQVVKTLEKRAKQIGGKKGIRDKPQEGARLVCGEVGKDETWLLPGGIGMMIWSPEHAAAGAIAGRVIARSSAVLAACVWSLRLPMLRPPLVLAVTVGSLSGLVFAVPVIPVDAPVIFDHGDEALALAALEQDARSGATTSPKFGLDGRLHAREPWQLQPQGVKPPKALPLCAIDPEAVDWEDVAMRCVAETLGVIDKDSDQSSSQQHPSFRQASSLRTRAASLPQGARSTGTPGRGKRTDSGEGRPHSREGSGRPYSREGSPSVRREGSSRRVVLPDEGADANIGREASGLLQKKSFKSFRGGAGSMTKMHSFQGVAKASSTLLSKKGSTVRQRSVHGSPRHPSVTRPGTPPEGREEVARQVWFRAEAGVGDGPQDLSETHQRLMTSLASYQFPIRKLRLVAQAAESVGGPAKNCRVVVCVEMVARTLAAIARADINAMVAGDGGPIKTDSGRVDALLRSALLDDGGGFWGRVVEPTVNDKFGMLLKKEDIQDAFLFNMMRRKLGCQFRFGKVSGTLHPAVIASPVPAEHVLPCLANDPEAVGELAVDLCSDSAVPANLRAVVALQWVVSAVERGEDPGPAAALLDVQLPPEGGTLGGLSAACVPQLAHGLSLTEESQARATRARLHAERALRAVEGSMAGVPETAQKTVSPFASLTAHAHMLRSRVCMLSGLLPEESLVIGWLNEFLVLSGGSRWTSFAVHPLVLLLENSEPTPVGMETRVQWAERWRGYSNPAIADLITDTAFVSMEQGDLPRALAMFERALSSLSTAANSNVLGLCVARNNLAIAEYEMGRAKASKGTRVDKSRQWKGLMREVPEGAADHLKRALALFQAVIAEEKELKDSADAQEGRVLLANAINNAASVEMQWGHWGAAEELYAHALTVVGKEQPDEYKHTLRNIEVLRNRRATRAAVIAQRGMRMFLARSRVKYKRFERERKEEERQKLIAVEERARLSMTALTVDSYRRIWERRFALSNAEEKDIRARVWAEFVNFNVSLHPLVEMQNAEVGARLEIGFEAVREKIPALLGLTELRDTHIRSRIGASENRIRRDRIHTARVAELSMDEVVQQLSLLSEESGEREILEVVVEEYGGRQEVTAERYAEARVLAQGGEGIERERLEMRELRGRLRVVEASERGQRVSLLGECSAEAGHIAKRLGAEAPAPLPVPTPVSSGTPVSSVRPDSAAASTVASHRPGSRASSLRPDTARVGSEATPQPSPAPRPDTAPRPPSAPQDASRPESAPPDATRPPSAGGRPPLAPRPGSREQWGPGACEDEPRPQSASGRSGDVGAGSRADVTSPVRGSLSDLPPTGGLPTPPPTPAKPDTKVEQKVACAQRTARRWLAHRELRSRRRALREEFGKDAGTSRLERGEAEAREAVSDAEAALRPVLRGLDTGPPVEVPIRRQAQLVAGATEAAGTAVVRALASQAGKGDAAGVASSLRLARLCALAGKHKRERALASQALANAGRLGQAHRALRAAALNACACAFHKEHKGHGDSQPPVDQPPFSEFVAAANKLSSNAAAPLARCIAENVARTESGAPLKHAPVPRV
eukprot:Hpha_TRINITY_DN33841_c0_g1::TRINITY_DN33841_c0_g1_i1::g.27271::m.27271